MLRKKTFCTLLFTKSIHLKEQVFRGIYYLTQSELSKPHLHPPLLLQSIWETCCFAEWKWYCRVDFPSTPRVTDMHTPIYMHINKAGQSEHFNRAIHGICMITMSKEVFCPAMKLTEAANFSRVAIKSSSGATLALPKACMSKQWRRSKQWKWAGQMVFISSLASGCMPLPNTSHCM